MNNHKSLHTIMPSVLTVVLLALMSVNGYAQSASEERVKLEMFPLQQVQLLDSPFKKAMEVDGDYLMELEADRLLAPYMEEAGLEPKADHYGGWEAEGEIGSGLDGHSLGHYLSALSMIYASTGKAEYGERMNYVVDELRRAQQANGSGYVGGVPNGEEILHSVETDSIEAKPFSLNGSWVPWYNLHKLFAGLRDAYLQAGNEEALQVLTELSDWTVNWADGFSEEQFQEILQTEHGGMKEVMADMYEITGEEKYLDLSRRFNHQTIFSPLANNADSLAGLHANTQIPKIIGAARDYEVSGNEEMRDIARYFWNTVVQKHSYANGGNSDHEHFSEWDTISDDLTRWSSESCNTYNMLKLTRHLTQWDANPAYADYYERALYNHILASQDPQTGMFAYYMSMEEGFYKTFSKPFDSFWCCVGSGMENHTKYGRYIYMHTDDALYVNLFIPSELNWEGKGVTVRQETRFPESDETRLQIETMQPEELTLNIRRPYWAGDGFEIRVNDKAIPVPESPSSYIAINRTWSDGDMIEVHLPKRIRTESLGTDENKVAMMYGPLLMAGIVGNDVPIQGQYASKQYDYFEFPSVKVPDLQPQGASPAEWVKQTDEPLRFQFVNVGEADGIMLAPYYQVNHNYYNIYWDVQSPATAQVNK